MKGKTKKLIRMYDNIRTGTSQNLGELIKGQIDTNDIINELRRRAAGKRDPEAVAFLRRLR